MQFFVWFQHRYPYHRYPCLGKESRDAFLLLGSFGMCYRMLTWSVLFSSRLCMYIRRTESKKRLNRLALSFPPCRPLRFEIYRDLHQTYTSLGTDIIPLPEHEEFIVVIAWMMISNVWKEICIDVSHMLPWEQHNKYIMLYRWVMQFLRVARWHSIAPFTRRKPTWLLQNSESLLNTTFIHTFTTINQI